MKDVCKKAFKGGIFTAIGLAILSVIVCIGRAARKYDNQRHYICMQYRSY